MLRKGIVKNSINFPNQWKIELDWIICKQKIGTSSTKTPVQYHDLYFKKDALLLTLLSEKF